MTEWRLVLSTLGTVCALMIWPFLSVWAIGVAEWDGRHEPGGPWSMAVVTVTALGCVALLVAVLVRPRRAGERRDPRRVARGLAGAAALAWLVLVTVLAY